MSMDTLIQRIVQTQNPTVVGLDPMLEYIPEHIVSEAFAKAGADIITVHLEACVDVRETLDLIHRFGCRAGISIKPETPVEALEASTRSSVSFLSLWDWR